LWGKSTNFELDCKVPLLIYNPEYKDHPKRINDIVELIDIYPTLTDLCGLKPTHTLSGQSLRFLIENKTNWKNRAFSQFPRPYKAVNSYKNQTYMGYTVRTKNWRYTLWYNNATNHITARELYYMNGSKVEKENLSGKREYVDIENELQQMIEDYKNTHNK
ncbi:sulfatase/phosphatase domain-containing protein, partial [Parabacteroides johnsonii]|uniref:sulfatase/phosphatase domain-containing protein n=1 Tax=Parabacteroides johnsonii TaxID=387661 RepID=UPI003119C442